MTAISSFSARIVSRWITVFKQTRQWFKEAGLQFPVAVSGNQLTKADFDWFAKNGMGVIVPRMK